MTRHTAMEERPNGTGCRWIWPVAALAVSLAASTATLAAPAIAASPHTRIVQDPVFWSAQKNTAPRTARFWMVADDPFQRDIDRFKKALGPIPFNLVPASHRGILRQLVSGQTVTLDRRASVFLSTTIMTMVRKCRNSRSGDPVHVPDSDIRLFLRYVQKAVMTAGYSRIGVAAAAAGAVAGRAMSCYRPTLTGLIGLFIVSIKKSQGRGAGSVASRGTRFLKSCWASRLSRKQCACLARIGPPGIHQRTWNRSTALWAQARNRLFLPQMGLVCGVTRY